VIHQRSERMTSTLKRLLQRRARPMSKRALLIIMVATSITLVVATIWAWRSTNLSIADVNFAAIAAVFLIAAPVTLVLKMFEYDASLRLIGSHAAWRHALDVSVVSSAANQLPIPGSLLVTTRSLSERGATYGAALVATSIPGLAWLGLSGLIGGVAIVIAGGLVLGTIVFAFGVLGLSAAGLMFRRNAPDHGRARLATRICTIEILWVVLSGFRFWLVLQAIHVSSTPAQVLSLAVVGAMSVAVGFVPGGLGVRELLIAGLSPVIHLPVSEGILLGVIDRGVWLAFLSLAVVCIVASHARSRREHTRENSPKVFDERPL
jgi:hypothetical protein